MVHCSIKKKLFSRETHYVWKGESRDIKEPNGKKVFSRRGEILVIRYLWLTLERMPQYYKHRPFYEDLFKTMATKLLEVQLELGLWRTSLACLESFDQGEVSGSAFYIFALTWVINNNLIDKELYEPALRKAWKERNG